MRLTFLTTSGSPQSIVMTLDDTMDLQPQITDPNSIQVQYVDQATFHGCQRGTLDLTLCTIVPMPDASMNFIYEAVISARLRFDVKMARALVEGLTKQIAMVESLYAAPDAPARNTRRRLAN